MAGDANLNSEFLIRERDIAVAQARTQVAIQIAVLAAILSTWAVLGFPRHVAWTVGIFMTGVATTAYDLRWWLWLRRAQPAEAFRFLQERDAVAGGRRVRLLTTGAALVVFSLWWWLTR